MDDLPTPETDNAPKFYFGDNRPSMETECVSADFARNLERQRDMLLRAIPLVHLRGCKYNKRGESGDFRCTCDIKGRREALANVKGVAQ